MITFFKYLAGLASALCVLVVAGSYVISEGIVDAFIGARGVTQGAAVVAEHKAQMLEMSSMEIPADLQAKSGRNSYSEPEISAPREISHSGKTRSYHLHVAQTMLPGARSVVVVLHGADRTGASMIDMWRDVADDEGVILIAPNSAGSSWSWKQDGPDLMAAILEDVRAEHRLNPTRVFLFGHSDGGAHALKLANDPTVRWRAVSSHAGFPGAGSIKKLGGLPPVRIYIGTDDRRYSADTTGKAGMLMADAGHPTDVVRVRGHNHWYYKAGPHLNREIWDWFDGR